VAARPLCGRKAYKRRASLDYLRAADRSLIQVKF
jgi:hypothetical protein